MLKGNFSILKLAPLNHHQQEFIYKIMAEYSTDFDNLSLSVAENKLFNWT